MAHNSVPMAEVSSTIRNVPCFESVASLLGIVIDRLNVLRYFPGPKLTTEGSYVGTGRISSRLY
jgi:hypothetical protein